MRILTSSEQREIEQLRAEVVKMPSDGLEIFIPITDREEWINILDILLHANQAMQLTWRRSDNPSIDLVKLATDD